MNRKRTYKEIVADLERAKARLKDVQERGNEAISAYDLRFGYDAEFYLVRCPLLQNHVNFYERELQEYKRLNNQLTLF